MLLRTELHVLRPTNAFTSRAVYLANFSTVYFNYTMSTGSCDILPWPCHTYRCLISDIWTSKLLKTRGARALSSTRYHITMPGYRKTHGQTSAFSVWWNQLEQKRGLAGSDCFYRMWAWMGTSVADSPWVLLLVRVKYATLTRALNRLQFYFLLLTQDNTLTAPYADEPHPLVEEGLQRCMEIFEGRVCILSNSAGTRQA